MESGDTGKGPEVALSDDSPVPNSSVPTSSVPGESARKKSMNRLVRRRASDSPILDVPWSEYLRVVESVAGFTGEDKQLEATITRWGMNPHAWLVGLEQLDRRCSRVLGTANHVLARAGEVAQRWFQGIDLCRAIFADSDSHSDAFT